MALTAAGAQLLAPEAALIRAVDAIEAAAARLPPIQAAVASLERLLLAVLPPMRPFVHASHLPFMNPAHVLLVALLYLQIVLVGVAVMKNLPKQNPKLFAMAHNVFLSSLSAYMCASLTAEAFRNNYSLLGNAVDPTANGARMARLLWLFYFSKVTEFVDTFIMVVKKNNHQISFLHLYHHTSILLVWWLIIYIAPGGDSWFSAALNSFIHVVMYGYYFLSSLGFKQVAFVKKYITLMQMVQFCMMMVQALGDSYLYPFYARLRGLDTLESPFPVVCAKILLWYMVSMLALFMNFYIKDRKKDKQRKQAIMMESTSKIKKTN
ncbi:hypothetical protein HDU82_007784 [Entophlyctis luteolus]|nr:hypothetical protein HDU82_007784 [Entophlyctis luteolus]